MRIKQYSRFLRYATLDQHRLEESIKKAELKLKLQKSNLTNIREKVEIYQELIKLGKEDK